MLSIVEAGPCFNIGDKKMRHPAPWSLCCDQRQKFLYSARKGIIFIGEDSASYKAGNIKMDLKKAFIAGIEFAASISKPESIFNYIQLIIVSVFFIGKSAKQELSSLEAYVIYLLHEKVYNTGVEEERFISEVQEWYQRKEGKAVDRDDIVDAMNNLYRIKVADFNDGNIYLKEHVWGTVK